VEVRLTGRDEPAARLGLERLAQYSDDPPMGAGSI